MNFKKCLVLLILILPLSGIPKISNEFKIAAGIGAFALTAGTSYWLGNSRAAATLRLRELEQKKQADIEINKKKEKEQEIKRLQDQATQRLEEIQSTYKAELSSRHAENITEENIETIIKKKFYAKQFPYYSYYKQLPQDIVLLKKLSQQIPLTKKADLELTISTLEKFREKTNEYFGKHIRQEKTAVQERREKEAQLKFEDEKRKLELENARLQIQNKVDKHVALTELKHLLHHSKEIQNTFQQAIHEIKANQTSLTNVVHSIAQSLLQAIHGIMQRIDTLERKNDLHAGQTKLNLQQQSQTIIKHIDDTKKEIEKRAEERNQQSVYQQQPPATFQPTYQSSLPVDVIHVNPAS